MDPKEETFKRNAQVMMVSYNHEGFKQAFGTLYSTIMASMDSHARYTIKQERQSIIDELINKPQFTNFIEAVKCEMAHHEQRWGDESQTPPHHFQMVLSMITGKLARAIFDKDQEKFTHHLITLAAVAGTAHKYLETNNSLTTDWFKK